jgi:hypothetical protein
VQVRLKSVSKEQHFILEAEAVFRPYFTKHCSGANETSYVALPAHAMKAVQVRFKLGINVAHFTLETET